jgi:glycosyltransferase involved in cell wall biosynthesis
MQTPPEGIEYSCAKPRKFLGRFRSIYRKYGDIYPVKKTIELVQPYIFNLKASDDSSDLIHFVQILPSQMPEQPFVIELSHVLGLSNYCLPGQSERNNILRILSSDLCKAIIFTSQRAADTLEAFLEDDFIQVKNKVEVVYPAIKPFDVQGDDSLGYFSSAERLKLLFVGNDCYRKGLHELLLALKQIDKQESFELHVVSDDGYRLKDVYGKENIHFHKPQFTKSDILSNFFIPADVFVMPSHHELFGMAFLDALCVGTSVIAIDQYSTSEIVSDGEDGILIKSERVPLDEHVLLPRELCQLDSEMQVESGVVDLLAHHIKSLIDNPDQVKRMGEKAKEKFLPGGRFSIENRNARLLKIYGT